MRRFALTAVLATSCACALAVTQAEVMAGAERLYRKRVAQLAQAYALDADAAFLARATRIAGVLIAQARRDYPDSAAWAWEIHTTTDPGESASCMAGGKLMVGKPYVDGLRLDDAELAMLLSHEIAHATAYHNLKEFDEALRLDPSWQERPFAQLEDAIDNDSALVATLSALNFAQEAEADREGLKLAWRAGWPAIRLANYYRKAARASGMANFDSRTHPSPSSRWQAARELAESLPAR